MGLPYKRKTTHTGKQNFSVTNELPCDQTFSCPDCPILNEHREAHINYKVLNQ